MRRLSPEGLVFISNKIRSFAGSFFIYTFLDLSELGKTMFFKVVLFKGRRLAGQVGP